MTRLAVIVAVAKNGVIGRDNELPWKLRADLQWFKRTTTDNTIVMGRKTYESIGRPLPNRDNIVLSRNGGLKVEGCVVVDKIEMACAKATRGDVFVIGGAQIYRRALPKADRLFITVVDAEVEGDTWLPFIDLADWLLVSSETVTADEHNEYDCELREYHRR
ncbi:MAG: dihydrofolate reductase [Gammaproteobacteria bacterium]